MIGNVSFISMSKQNTFIKNTFTDCLAATKCFKGVNASIVTEGKGRCELIAKYDYINVGEVNEARAESKLNVDVGMDQGVCVHLQS